MTELREPIKEDYRLTKGEMETIINWCMAEDTVSYYTTTPAEVRYIERLIAKFGDEICVKQRDKYGLEVILPRSWYRRPAPPVKRDLTDEQRAEIAARMRALHAARDSQ